MSEDDGTLRTFETGATRDTSKDKLEPHGFLLRCFTGSASICIDTGISLMGRFVIPTTGRRGCLRRSTPRAS